jgi:hypothetical protein
MGHPQFTGLEKGVRPPESHMRSSIATEGFVGDGEEGLELRRLRLLVDAGCLRIGEAGFFQHGFELGFAEA